MKKTTTIIGVVAVIALLVAIWAKATPASTPIVGAANYGNTSTDGTQTNLPNPTNYDYLVARLSLGLGTNTSVSGSGVGNINISGQRAQMLASAVATSTPCVIQNPNSSTSTITNLSFQVTTGTTTSGFVTIATSTSPNATTSLITTGTIGSNAQGLITWDGGINNNMIPGFGYVVFGVSGISSGFSYNGTCSAVFQSI